MSVQHRTAEAAERAPTRRRLTFSTPLSVSLVAVLAIAVVAGAVLLGPRGLFGPGSAPSPATLNPTTEPTPALQPTVEPTAEPEPTERPSPSPTVTSAPTPLAIPDWTKLAWSDPVVLPGYNIYDVAEWGDEFVATAHIPTDAPDGAGAFLTSPDGLTWTVAQQVEPGFDRWPARLVSTEGRLIATSMTPGHDTPGVENIESGAPLMWTSTDGHSWQLMDSPSWRDAWKDAILFGLVDGPSGLVAIGTSWGMAGNIPYMPVAAEAVGVPRMYHSVDGLVWDEVQLPPSSGQVWGGIISTDSGYAIVGGEEVVYEGGWIASGHPAAWFSTDGTRWTASSIEGTTGSIGYFTGELAASSNGLAATSMSEAQPWPVNHIWSSVDGRSWHVADETPSPTGRFAGDGRHIVQLAHSPSALTSPYTGAWGSRDGSDWTQLTVQGALPDEYVRFWVVADGMIAWSDVAETVWFAAGSAD